MRRGIFWSLLVAFCAMGNAACGGGSNSTPTLTVKITTAPASMSVGTTANVVATVSHDSAAGGVTWNCTPAAACGATSFSPDATASGAMSVFTAPAAIPSGGTVTITAASVTSPGVTSGPVNITITGGTTKSQNFSFYVSGVALNDEGHDPYDIAGVVAIATDGSGTVTSGVQDYSDGDRIASPEPQGDAITSGSLVMTANGLGTLTLVTNNSKLGVAGMEMLAVAFANSSHALITQFDGSATSSGSLDLQTSTALPSGAFSFVVAGSGNNDEALVYGGVFTVDASGNITGMGDMNDGGEVSLGTPIPAGAMLSTPDTFGRGTITTDTVIFGTVNYYVVGLKTFRIVETELGQTAVGSAYSQGANPNFSSASIGASVFSLGQSIDFYSAAGQFTVNLAASAKNGPTSVTHAGAAAESTSNFGGVGDLNEVDGPLLPAASINGTYTLAANGYGSMTFAEGFGDVAVLGLYAVDPTLNILDPNNTTDTAAEGGAVIAEMDTNLVGIGAVLPQTDTTLADFKGAYAFGAQGRSGSADGFEFDYLGETNVTAGAFAGTAALSDPFAALTRTAGEFSKVTIAGTAAEDASHAGRFTFSPLAISGTEFASPVNLTVTVYQASAGQLVWVQMDPNFESGGTIEQNTLAPAEAARSAVARPQDRLKPEGGAAPGWISAHVTLRALDPSPQVTWRERVIARHFGPDLVQMTPVASSFQASSTSLVVWCSRVLSLLPSDSSS